MGSWLARAMVGLWLLLTAVAGGYLLDGALRRWPSMVRPLVPVLFLLVVAACVIPLVLWCGSKAHRVPVRILGPARESRVWGRISVPELRTETGATVQRVECLRQELAELRAKRGEGS